MKILCFFRRENASIATQLLEFHPAEKYKLQVPDPKEPSRMKWQTYERGFVFSKDYGVQHIDTGLIDSISKKRAAAIMQKFLMKDRIAVLGKKQFLLEEPEDEINDDE